MSRKSITRKSKKCVKYGLQILGKEGRIEIQPVFKSNIL
jgi:hypothetical protein